MPNSPRDPAARLPRALLVEDDAPLRDLLTRVISKAGYDVYPCPAAAPAREAIEAGGIDVLVTDLRLPDGDGVELIELARRTDPRTAIIAVTAFGSIDLAVRAVRQGAYEFLTKPVEPAALCLAIERAVEARTLRGEIDRLRAALGAQARPPLLVGHSRALADIAALVERLADSDVTVLVTGPSGSGKEMVARALHLTSRRRDRPFVAVNAAAIPDNLLESELFGHMKGAFTDARTDRRGLFQEADGGTLFLDEIGDLALLLQAKLLRALQEREVRPVGATRSTPVDVRVVAATQHDLRRAAAAGRFRLDLYYRLAVVEIAIPALRDRREDIMPLAEHFLRRAVARTGRPLRGFSAAAAQRLLSHAWPGNVRELENAVERAVALARDEWIGPDDLPPTLEPAGPPDLFAFAAERMMTLEEIERGYVRHVLERLGGNKKRAADALGINRRTIQRWLGEGAGSGEEEPEQ